ncbi:MAG: DNA polymerase [Bacteroidales bacterium]|nr:DNA polymerase [Bacteroidales bacterium]
MFYFPEENKSEEKPKKNIKEYNCQTCGLYKKAHTPKMQVTIGKDYNGLVIVSDYPGKNEDEKGIPFVGKSGNLLRTIALKNKINLAKKSAVTYALSCKPDSKKPSETLFKCCKSLLHKRIKQLKPKLIICLGEHAANAIIRSRKKQAISKLRGRLIPNYEFDCLVYISFSPSELFYKDSEDRFDKTLETSFRWDMEKIFKLWNTKLYKRKVVKKTLEKRKILEGIQLKEIKTKSELDKVIEELYKNGSFAFDYETTNLKPYDDDFQIYSCQFGIKDKAWGVYFPHFKDIQYLKSTIYRILSDPEIKKYIQHDKFEEVCSRRLLEKPGERILQNSFCTMVANHIVEAKQKCSNLNFMNLVRFGIPEYDEKTHNFLKPKSKTDKVNRIHLVKPDDLLLYGNLDVITTYNQGIVLDNNLLNEGKYRWCYELVHDAHLNFADVEEEGFPVNKKKLDELDKYITDLMDDLIEQIGKIPEVRRFLKKIVKEGFKEKKDGQGGLLGSFLRSPKELQKFLYEELKLTPIKQTKTGNSTDQDVITEHAEKDSVLFCKLLANHRKLFKAKSSYIDNIRKNLNDDGKVHGSIMVLNETFRSSIADPPLQTVPKHGSIIENVPWKIIREIFELEDTEYLLGQVDMSGWELTVGAAVSGDKAFIEDVNNIDIHAYWAKRLFGFDKTLEEIKKLYKPYRQISKNVFVFAGMYGAIFTSIARDMRTYEEYLEYCKKIYRKSKTNMEFMDWVIPFSENHVENCQKDFYGKYKRLREWQDEEVTLYYQNKYVELPMGFRRHYPLTRNEIINTPIQGTSFLIILDSFNKVMTELKKRKMKSKVILETHDDMTFKVYKPETLDLIEMVDNIILHPPFDFMKDLNVKSEWTFGRSLNKMKEVQF